MATQQRIYLSSTAADRFPLGESRSDAVVFDLSEPVVCKSNQKMYLSLEHFSFPNTLYNITPGKNEILVNSTPASIPVGQYATASALATAINTAFTAASIPITVTYSTLTNKYSFQNTSGTVIQYIRASSEMWYPIGILAGEDLLINISSTVVAPRQVDVGNGRTINFSVNNLDFNGLDSNGNKSLSTILGTIPINVAFGDVQSFTNYSDNRVLVNQKNITFLDVRLINLNNEPFDIGGLKWAAVLLVTII